jgi:hypothetical protein
MRVNVSYGCWAQGEDSVALWYYNTAGWRLLQSWNNSLTGCDASPDGTDGSVAVTFTPDALSGTHVVRAIEAAAGGNPSASSCPSITRGDFDDMSFSVTATQTVVGDINKDGAVNIQDVLVVINGIGSSNTQLDLNADGKINVFDAMVVVKAMNA